MFRNQVSFITLTRWICSLIIYQRQEQHSYFSRFLYPRIYEWLPIIKLLGEIFIHSEVTFTEPLASFTLILPKYHFNVLPVTAEMYQTKHHAQNQDNPNFPAPIIIASSDMFMNSALILLMAE